LQERRKLSASTPVKVKTPVSAFLTDIKPFFFNRALIYADIGAHDGGSFEAVLDMGFSVSRAVLIEANPQTFERLQEAVAAHDKTTKVTCLNLAMSDRQGLVQLRDRTDMGPIVAETLPADAAAETGAKADHHVQIEARPFDTLADLFPDGHVSILKIDVEGHETQVLRGCGAMLAAEAIDVLYIDTGMRSDDPEQSDFRSIDDSLAAHGYRLFRIYEQTHEWIADSPALRRFCVAYFSPKFEARFPMTMTQELTRLGKELEAKSETITSLTAERDAALARIERQAATLQDRFREIAFLTQSVEAIIEERDAALSKLRMQAEEKKKRAEAADAQGGTARVQGAPQKTARKKKGISNLGILVGGLVFYVVAIVAGLLYYLLG
jgi:FkbM family methyltransferase